MAFGDVVGTPAEASANATGVTVTFAAATAGNLLVAGFAHANNQGSYTDPSGWTLITSVALSAGNMFARWYYKVAAGGETSVTGTGNTSGVCRGVVAEFAGPFASTPLDVSAENEANISTAVTSEASGTTGSTSQARALAVAFFAADSAANVTDGRGYSDSFSEVHFASTTASTARPAAALARKVLAATGAQSTTFSCSDTGDEMYGAVAVFKEDVGGVPAITLDTADASEFSVDTPTLEFTGTDPDDDDVRYQIQITDNPDAWASGSELEDNYSSGGGSTMHPNPHVSATAWNGNIQVDDRPGQSFAGNGGILDKIQVYFGAHEDYPEETDGVAYVRVYAHQGTFGTSSEPLNPAEPADTPTPNWLAVSDAFAFNPGGASEPAWREFTFSGANRIRLEDGTKYVWIIDWAPANRTYENTITVRGDATTLTHGGNCYLDGNSPANNGIWGPSDHSNIDQWFKVYESYVLHDKTSGTDNGFANTTDGGDTDPFDSGDKASFTVQAGDGLANGTYRWRVRASDPNGSGAWSDWSATRTFTVDTGGGVAGSAALTAPTATSSASGKQTFAGAIAAVAIAATIAATGSVGGGVSGTAAVTAPAAAIAAAGAVTFKGPAAVTAPPGTVAASGAVAFRGTSGLTAPVATIAATGGIAFRSTAVLSAPLATVAGNGALAFKGDAPLTAPVARAAAAGSVRFAAAAALTAPRATAQATGALAFKGSAALSAPVAELAGQGKEAFSGDAALTAPAAAIEALGAIGGAIIGTADLSAPPATLSGSGKQAFVGTAAASAPPAGLAAEGSALLAISGTAALRAPAASAAAQGTQAFRGPAAASAPAAVLTSQGKQSFVGRADVAAPSSVLAGAGALQFVAASATQAPAATLAAEGSISLDIAGAAALAAPVATVAATGVVELTALPSPERTFTVFAESRTVTVEADNRAFVVPAESRMFIVPGG